MHDTCRVVKILNGIKHLIKVVPSISLRKTSCLILKFNEREEVALFDQLKDNEKYLDRMARFAFNDLASNLPVIQADDVRMTDVLEQLHFVV